MLRLQRPVPPANFNQKSKLAFKKIKTSHPAKISFNEKFWGEFKPHFDAAQYSKCGYCEAFITDYGDVEHYRPKAIVEEIKSQGEERPNQRRIKKRKFEQVCASGYWWLAYSWDNYLLSCSLCNRPWKKALFPIAQIRPKNVKRNSNFRFASPKPGSIEEPLLLNPFDCDTISDHLGFTKFGAIYPHKKSSHGSSTIKTCGLDRPSLTQFRHRKAIRAYRFLQKFASAAKGSLEERETAFELFELGNEKENFAGMVRVLFEQFGGGAKWSNLEDFVKKAFPDRYK